mmetsp:Transcript_3698/g.12939  ORF Transcript_3698/g.12939 Transcript_3698/m.12939 type:complete len:213 (+) Transcript_3698:960-1598(+)
MALSRLRSCVRSSVQKMRIPVGLCCRSTAVSTLFTFCPPAPPDRAVVSVMSLGSMSTSTSSTSGITATDAVDVCTRPWVSVAGTRCTRCTPASHFSLLYTLSPVMPITTSRYPPWSFSVWLMGSIFHPISELYFSYMRRRSPAHMPASSPPAPARISSMMLRSSRGSPGKRSMVSLSSISSMAFASSSASSFAMAAISGSSALSLTISLAPS